MGIMGVPPPRSPAEVEAERRERTARKDAQTRADMIREGRERPDNEFLGLGVVIRDDEVLVWSTTIVHVLGALAGAQAGIVGPSRPEVQALQWPPLQPSGYWARLALSVPVAPNHSPTLCSPTGYCIRTNSATSGSRPAPRPTCCGSTRWRPSGTSAATAGTRRLLRLALEALVPS